MQVVPFKQVDVFTTRALGGNPVAVILDADGLEPDTMQRIARWTNLSETAFLLTPDHAEASYRVRIFTPVSELPFAGHPSIGSAHAALEAGLVQATQGRLVQQCAAGLLPMRVQDGGASRQIAVRAPAARRIDADAGALLDPALAGLARGAIEPQLWDNGPRWWMVEAADERAVREHIPDPLAIAALTRATGAVGLAAFADVQGDSTLQRVVRAWCPADGIPEDPVTGSVNASIGACLHAAGRVQTGSRYVASQGREVGRDGRVTVEVAQDGVWIAGHSVTVVDGMIRFDD